MEHIHVILDFQPYICIFYYVRIRSATCKLLLQTCSSNNLLLFSHQAVGMPEAYHEIRRKPTTRLMVVLYAFDYCLRYYFVTNKKVLHFKTTLNTRTCDSSTQSRTFIRIRSRIFSNYRHKIPIRQIVNEFHDFINILFKYFYPYCGGVFLQWKAVFRKEIFSK